MTGVRQLIMGFKGRPDKRVEPSFDGSRQNDDFRLDAEERVVGNGRTAKRSPKAGNEDRSESRARSGQSQRARPSRNKPSRRRGEGGLFSPLRTLIYWCLVLGIWAGIGVGGRGRY